VSIKRVITDVPAADVPFVSAMVAADGGVIVEQLAETDGEFTLVAEFPSPQAPIATAKKSAQSATMGAKGDAKVADTVSVMEQKALAADAWTRVAQAELSNQVAEIPGAASNPRIEQYHATTGGGAALDSVPWCSSFVNFCVVEAGGKGTRSKAARSWMTWGKDAGSFEPGCIVILSRGKAPKGHVAFFVGFDGDQIRLLGGNQGSRVSVASFDRSRVLARRLAA
jgi:uncharacterized protein (TIGR02594 family)